MSQQTYTPTHCPETGRKFTKAERKAANKARYAAERAAQTPKPKSKRKPKAQKEGGVPDFEQTKAQLKELLMPDHPTKPTPTRSKAQLMKMTKAQLVELLMPEPKPEPKAKRKAKRKATPSVKRPKRSSAAGIEQAQARANVGIGTPKKTKVVDAATGGDAEVFRTRMAVPVEEPKARKKQIMKITLLPGEDVLTAVRRVQIQAEQASAEASRLEAESLLNAEA